MAPFTFTARFLTIQLMLLLSATAIVSARPCKTLFISSYSFALRRLPNQNPNLQFAGLSSNSNSDSYSGFLTISTTTFTGAGSQFNGKPALFYYGRRGFPDRVGRVEAEAAKQRAISSLLERSKDVLSVVVALLFGVGCGALTAATMYLAWSLVAGNRPDLLPESDDDYDYDASPKKMGYVKIATPDQASPIPSSKA